MSLEDVRFLAWIAVAGGAGLVSLAAAAISLLVAFAPRTSHKDDFDWVIPVAALVIALALTAHALDRVIALG